VIHQPQRSLILLLMLLIVLVLTACRRADDEGQIFVATLTPTPRSTPLPPVATVVPPGSEENPLRMLIRPASTALRAAAQNDLNDFQTALQEQSGLVIEVVLVESYAEAVGALCDSSAGQVAVAWLDGVSYMAAMSQNCGKPIMQVERGQRADAQTGESVQMMVSADSGLSALSALDGKNFCRISAEDVYSWLVPSLMLRAAGVDPLSFAAITDYETIPEMLEAVAEGDCDAAAVSARQYENAERDIGDAAEQLQILETSVNFPYNILMYPLELPLGQRLALDDALLNMAANDETASLMQSLLGQDDLVRVEADDFEDFTDFMESTGFNFAQLGA
jgi:ABC-type phosphate/phosphonate transport system substrate-binding protein